MTRMQVFQVQLKLLTTVIRSQQLQSIWLLAAMPGTKAMIFAKDCLFKMAYRSSHLKLTQFQTSPLTLCTKAH